MDESLYGKNKGIMPFRKQIPNESKKLIIVVIVSGLGFICAALLSFPWTNVSSEL